MIGWVMFAIFVLSSIVITIDVIRENIHAKQKQKKELKDACKAIVKAKWDKSVKLDILNKMGKKISEIEFCGDEVADEVQEGAVIEL